MKYAFTNFTLHNNEPVIVHGNQALYTCQNTGNTSGLIQGSNDAVTWFDIVSIPPNTTLIQEHSYKYLRLLGNTTVQVNRGNGNNKNDSSGGGTGGGNGQGFIFNDLTNHISEIEQHAVMEYFSIGPAPTVSGNNRVGSITIDTVGAGMVAYFQVAPQTSYKVRLFPNSLLQIMATKQKVDFANAGGPGNDPFLEAGAKGIVNLVIGEGTIDTNVENQNIYLEFGQQAEDWLEITQTGTELIWTINGVEVVRTPQDPEDNWFNTLILLEDNGVNEPKVFQYDLTNTIAKYTIELNLTSIEDMVIYRSSHDLKVLDRFIAVGDYVQFYENKTKVIIYPQLSNIYDFDASDPENRVTVPITLTNHNPFITVDESENGQGTITVPRQEYLMDGLEDVTEETLENFYIHENTDIEVITLRIKEDFDPDGLISFVEAEFKISKGYIYNIADSLNSAGNASEVNYYFYAGEARDKNYIHLKWSRYPNQYKAWTLVGETGTEIELFSVNYLGDVKISLKDNGISLRAIPNSNSLTVVETAEDYSKYLDFSDQNNKITVRVTYEVTEDAIQNSGNYSRPIQWTICGLSKTYDYVNLKPVEIDFTAGSFHLKPEKHKSFGFYFCAANSLQEVCAHVESSNSNLQVVMLNVLYDAQTETYNYFLNAEHGGSASGSMQLGESTPMDLHLERNAATLALDFNGETVTSIGVANKKLFIVAISGLFGVGIYEQNVVGFDRNLIQGNSALNLDKVKNRDRIHIIGMKDTINGITVNPGDVVEFFKNKTEILVSKKPTPSSDIDSFKILTVRNSYNQVDTNVKAWFDPVLKRIMVSGTIYYSGYGSEALIVIDVPTGLYDRLGANLRVGYFADQGIKTYISSELFYTEWAQGQINVNIPHSGGAYMTGYINLPDVTVATVVN